MMSMNNIDSNYCKEATQECSASSCGGIIEVSEQADDNVCASCGIAALDNVKLKKCACELVKYCSIECQKEHRPKHKRACKKRTAELHEQLLFAQPDSSCHGDCPICFLPMPLDLGKAVMKSCCSKRICYGCDYAHHMSNKNDEEKARSCPFCREPFAYSDEENIKRVLKRVEAGVPAALTQMGTTRYEEGDYDTALEYWTKAAQSGDFDAHFKLGSVYMMGRGVEKDEGKVLYHYEKAAIGGHSTARYVLARIEEENGRLERAVKHIIIAAKLGETDSMKALWEYYKHGHGHVNKEDLNVTLRVHQAAIDAMKSPQREAAKAFYGA
jgi:hypothetical protein